MSNNQANFRVAHSRRKAPKSEDFETPFTEISLAIEEMIFLADQNKKRSYAVAIGVNGNFYVMPEELAEGLPIVDRSSGVQKRPAL